MVDTTQRLRPRQQSKLAPLDVETVKRISREDSNAAISPEKKSATGNSSPVDDQVQPVSAVPIPTRRKKASSAQSKMARALDWRNPMWRMPRLPIGTRHYWRSAIQYFCVTCCVYCLPAVMFMTVCLWAWSLLLTAWVILDFTGLVGPLTSVCGACEYVTRGIVVTGLETFIYVFGQVFGLGHGAQLLDTVRHGVDERGGYRHVLWWTSVVYLVFGVVYFAHIMTDKRWQGPAVNRSDTLRRTAWFKKHLRGYFPAEWYVDSALSKSERRLSFHRIDGPPSRHTDDAVDAAIRTFPAVRDDDPNEPERYLFCCHPHGLFTFSIWCIFNAWTQAFHRLFDERGFVTTIHTLRVNFTFPVWREMLLDFRFSDCSRTTLHRALGGTNATHHRTVPRAVKSVSNATVLDAKQQRKRHAKPHGCIDSESPDATPLKKDGADKKTNDGNKKKNGDRADDISGRPLCSVLVPGGAEESMNCTEAKLTLGKRKGFIRCALATGANLVPVYTFGETDLYSPVLQYPFVMRMLMKFEKATGVGTPLVVGEHFINFFVPKRKRLRTVFGKPINTRRYWRVAVGSAGEPAGIEHGERFFTDEDVDKLHAEYTDALVALFRKYQPRLDADGPRELTLE